MKFYTDEARIAKKAIRYLKRHGLTITQGWQINGTPPESVREYLDGMIEGCFPTDEDELEKEVIGLIETDLSAMEIDCEKEELERLVGETLELLMAQGIVVEEIIDGVEIYRLSDKFKAEMN
jgi:hypothetical protein